MVTILPDMPLLILSFISAILIALMVLGYIYRTSFPMSFIWFITGVIFLLIFVTTETISLGALPVNQTYDNNTNTIINTYDNDKYPIKVFDNNTNTYTAEPNFVGMMLIILALSFIMVGILIERT